MPSEKEDSSDFQTEKWDIGAAGSTTALAVLTLQGDALCTCGWVGPSLLEYFHVLLDMYQHGWAAGTRTQSHLILLHTHSTSQTS